MSTQHPQTPPPSVPSRPSSRTASRLAWPLALAPVAALAKAAPPPAPGGSFLGEVLAVVLPVIFVIAGLLAVLYFARRRYGLTGRSAPLSVMQVLPVGPRERIVLVRTRAGRVFAVGVGAHSLNLIAQLEPEDVAPDTENAVTEDGPRHLFRRGNE